MATRVSLKTSSTIQSPKRDALRDRQWYDFYAMYSPQFVDSILTSVSFGKQDCILDPWNGTGTTTSAAWHLGVNALGLDLNPAMVLIARGRLLQQKDIVRLRDVGKNIEQMKKPVGFRLGNHDPLQDFFADKTVEYIRGLELVLRAQFSISEDPGPRDMRWVDYCTPLLACLYVVMFRSIRSLFSTFGTSNPTWFKRPVPENRVSVSWKSFRESISRSVVDAVRFLEKDTFPLSRETPDVRVTMGDSRSPVSQGITLTLTSPPYCTRIDYAVATLPELTLLGVTDEDFRDLRRKMIGTPVIARETECLQQPDGSSTSDQLLRTISRHRSYASTRYYLKTFKQYFIGMFRSLRSIDEVTRRGGRAVIVVQDSYFKDVRIDMPGIYTDYFEQMGWRLTDRTEFKTRTKGAIHRFASRYRPKGGATESVLTFQKG
jgi:hypothetical protein